MTLLSVNLNKIAVLRNSRGGRLPDVLAAAHVAAAAGCGGVTVHPRPDRRHIRPDDVAALASELHGPLAALEFNIEGNPFAGPRAGYPGFVELVLAARPTQVTLVPDGDGQLTSDHGWDLARDGNRLQPLIARFRDAGCRVSLFMDASIDADTNAGSEQMATAAAIGADRIELYTGPYAHAFAAGTAGEELIRCRATAAAAVSAGLGVNGGHDLDQQNLGSLLQSVPCIAEVSIGHALIAEALYDGLAPTVQRYLAVIARARQADRGTTAAI